MLVQRWWHFPPTLFLGDVPDLRPLRGCPSLTVWSRDVGRLARQPLSEDEPSGRRSEMRVVGDTMQESRTLIERDSST